MQSQIDQTDSYMDHLIPFDPILYNDEKRNAIKTKAHEIIRAVKACRVQQITSTFRSVTRTIVLQPIGKTIVIRISNNDSPGVFIGLLELLDKLPLTMQNIVTSLMNKKYLEVDNHKYTRASLQVSPDVLSILVSCIYHLDAPKIITPIKPPTLKLSNYNVLNSVPSLSKDSYYNHNGFQPVVNRKNRHKHHQYTQPHQPFQPPEPKIEMEYIITDESERTKRHANVVTEINNCKDRIALLTEFMGMHGIKFEPPTSTKYLDNLMSLEELVGTPQPVIIHPKVNYNVGIGAINWANFGKWKNY